MRPHPKADLYRAERQKGKTYSEIAREYGVSKQCVAGACASKAEYAFQPFTVERCVYPNLRQWLNNNKVSTREFVRRMGNVPAGTLLAQYSRYFKGISYPPKQIIDTMIKVTGLTYEKLFATDEDPGVANIVEVVRCDGCEFHGRCEYESVMVGFYKIEDPYCAVGMRAGTVSGAEMDGGNENG